MDLQQFWIIMEQVKDAENPVEAVKRLLMDMPPEEIVSYQEHFDALVANAYRWDLWAAAYLIEGGCGDDGFMDFRYALISKGQNVYEAALDNPDSLVEVEVKDEFSDELFGYAAIEVYEEKTGKEMPPSSVTEPALPLNEDWDFDFDDEDEMEKRLPRLSAKYDEKYWEEKDSG